MAVVFFFFFFMTKFREHVSHLSGTKLNRVISRVLSMLPKDLLFKANTSSLQIVLSALVSTLKSFSVPHQGADYISDPFGSMSSIWFVSNIGIIHAFFFMH